MQPKSLFVAFAALSASAAAFAAPAPASGTAVLPNFIFPPNTDFSLTSSSLLRNSTRGQAAGLGASQGRGDARCDDWRRARKIGRRVAEWLGASRTLGAAGAQDVHYGRVGSFGSSG
ncbi:hypothetical protein DFH11DRAFT_1729906 [Phellopilus nigrolimitatus]|nr:hypothetical protein DFH11DRAFT_1729906 [Phellopilus nigrolimitatus]